MYNLNIG